MNIDDCFYLGRITKPWGVKGQVMMFLDVDAPEDYLGLDSAFVEVKGQLVPYFFHLDNLNGNKAVARPMPSSATRSTCRWTSCQSWKATSSTSMRCWVSG